MIVSAYPFPPFLGSDPIKLFTSAVVRKAPRSLGAHVKSLNYLDGIIAKQQAGELGMHDAVMLDSLGAVAECTGANLFIIVGDTLVTPTTRAALPGITRRTVLELAAELGIEAVERDVWPAELHCADGAFVCGSGAGDRPDRLLRRAPGRAARAPVHRAAAGRLPRADAVVRIPDRALHRRPMRFLVLALALVALLAPPAASAAAGRVDTLATRDALTHGIAGDERYVFVTEPGVGVAPNGARVVALDRFTGAEVAAFPAPPGGFKLPFTLRVPRTGHLVVLDSGGFPPSGPPIVYDYRYKTDRRGFSATLARTTDFKGLPLTFAEDVEVLPNGEYVVSESIAGGLWLIGRDGEIRRGLVPDDGAPPLPSSAPCPFAGGGAGTVGGVAFAAPGGFAPGAGSLAVRGDDLYISSTCQGGMQKLPIRVLLDDSRPPPSARSGSPPSRRARTRSRA